MFKNYKNKKSTLIGICVSAVVILTFQNCAREMIDQYGNESDDTAYSGIIDEGYYNQGFVDESVKVETESVSTVVMDRSMIKSLFADVFGPSLTTQALSLRIESDQSIFGSPCSFADNYLGAVAGDNRVQFCANAQASDSMGASVLPSVNVLRVARVNELCYLATISLDNADGKTGPTNYVINRLKANPTDVLPESNDENILKLFRLFYRGKPDPQPELVSALKSIVGSPATKMGWKNAIYTTCVSGHWQVL